MILKYLLFVLTFLISIIDINAKIWYVVQGSSIPDPKSASTLAQDGDTVDIAYNSNPYLAYESKWPQNNLLIRGSGAGRPMLKAETFSVTQKAIFVIQGNNITIENIGFSNCTVPDKNGAGIRVEGVNLTVRHCLFLENEMGILAGDKANSEILVEYCEFAFSGYGDGYSHNIYINHVEKFVFQYNYSHDCKIGHLVKSRAFNNYILYNRLDSPQNGTPSREIDLPNGGVAVIIGNIIRQTPSGENSNLIGYGLEGLSNPQPHDICINNNTIINEKSNGSFVQLQSGTNLLKLSNNIFAGGGNLLVGSAAVLDTFSNFRTLKIDQAGFIDPQNLDFHLSDTSWAVNHGMIPGFYGNFNLLAKYEYVEPINSQDRKFVDKIDIGAFESDISTKLSEQIPDNGITLNKNCIRNDENNYSKLLITNILGENISFKTLSPGELFCFDAFVPGIYILSVYYSKNKVRTLKILINH